MTSEVTSVLEVAPMDLGEALSVMRLCSSQAQAQMQLSLSQTGQLTPVQAYQDSTGLQILDGFKRVRAARNLSWSKVRVEVHALDSKGAKAWLWRCNLNIGISDLEEAWLIQSLYRDDKLTQPQIAQLLGRHKSWVCRRLSLAQGLSDELSASVRLGLISATAAVELARLQRCNQDEAAKVVTRQGLTSRQTARLVNQLLTAKDTVSREHMLRDTSQIKPAQKNNTLRRTPAEQLVADAWAIKRIAARMQVRLLERSLSSLGEAACSMVARELIELHETLYSLNQTLDKRLFA
jgi:ParB-like chromosome segregation protein Spo0J